MIIEYNPFISINCICLSDSNPRDLYCASMCTDSDFFHLLGTRTGSGGIGKNNGIFP